MKWLLGIIAFIAIFSFVTKEDSVDEVYRKVQKSFRKVFKK